MSDEYPPGEVVTAGRIQDEPWYSDFQQCCEVENGFEFPGYFLPKGVALERGIRHAKAYFDQYPGPVSQGWKPPDNDRLRRWFGFFYDNTSSGIWHARRQGKKDHLLMLRPDNYDSLPECIKEIIDIRLGLI